MLRPIFRSIRGLRATLAAAIISLAGLLAPAAAQEELKAGDTIVVSAETANLMRGTNVLASVKKDDKLQVLKVQGEWIGTFVEEDGKRTGGWVLKSQVRLAPAAEEPTPEDKPEPKPEDKPEPKPEDKPEPKPEDKPEPKPEDKPEPKPEDKPEPKPEDKPEPKPEDTPEPKPEPKPDDKPEPKPESAEESPAEEGAEPLEAPDDEQG